MESPWNRISVRARVIATMRATVAICVAKTSRSPSATPTMRPASTIVGKLRQGRNTARVSQPPFKVGAAQVSPEASAPTSVPIGGRLRKDFLPPSHSARVKGRVRLGIVLAVVCVVVLPTLARGEAVDFRDDFGDASKVGASSGILYVLGAVTLPPVFPARHGVVLPRGTGGDVDASGVVPGSVLFEGGLYKIWYGACCGGGASSIAYATSTDGIAWTKQGAVVTPSLPAEAGGISYVEVVKVGATYWMWYTGSDGAVERIVGAESDDGITWRRGGLLLDTTPRESRVSDAAMLVRPDGSWLVYYASDSSAWQGFLAIRPAWSGWIRSISITKPDRATWARFNVTVPAPTGSSVPVTVRDAGSLAVVGGLENVTGGAVNLSGVDSAQHPTLVVEAWLRATAFAPPSLDSWEVSSPDLPATPTPLELPVLPFAIVIIPAVVVAMLIEAQRRARPSVQDPSHSLDATT